MRCVCGDKCSRSSGDVMHVWYGAPRCCLHSQACTSVASKLSLMPVKSIASLVGLFCFCFEHGAAGRLYWMVHLRPAWLVLHMVASSCKTQAIQQHTLLVLTCSQEEVPRSGALCNAHPSGKTIPIAGAAYIPRVALKRPFVGLILLVARG